MFSSDALKLDDYEELKAIKGIKYMSPTYSASYYSVKLLDPKETNTASITGVGGDYYNIMSPTLLYGTYINETDVDNKSKNVVITDTTAKRYLDIATKVLLVKRLLLKLGKVH